MNTIMFAGNQLPNSTYPNFYDSGWIPALFRRCESESHWTYHIKFNVKPTGGKFSATFELAICGRGRNNLTFHMVVHSSWTATSI